MANPKPHTVLPLWYRALEEEIGIAISASDNRFYTNLLYAARKEAQDDSLAKLSILQHGSGELWIIKQETELD